jgi:hypothetical protein
MSTKTPPVVLQLAFTGTDTVLDIHKVVGLHADTPTLFAVERMKDGGLRLTYNAIQITDLTKVQGITFIRQKEQNQ